MCIRDRFSSCVYIVTLRRGWEWRGIEGVWRSGTFGQANSMIFISVTPDLRHWKKKVCGCYVEMYNSRLLLSWLAYLCVHMSRVLRLCTHTRVHTHSVCCHRCGQEDLHLIMHICTISPHCNLIVTYGSHTSLWVFWNSINDWWCLIWGPCSSGCYRPHSCSYKDPLGSSYVFLLQEFVAFLGYLSPWRWSFLLNKLIIGSGPMMFYLCHHTGIWPLIRD